MAAFEIVHQFDGSWQTTIEGTKLPSFIKRSQSEAVLNGLINTLRRRSEMVVYDVNYQR